MQPTLGWTMLSRDAIRRAEQALKDGERRVRDEIGFLELHQGYADRFFPGTSVLQTRLRYALFVPWMYQELLERPRGERVERLIQAQECELAGRLYQSLATDKDGVIGGTIYPKPAAQPPSLSYWTALGTWGILRRLEGGRPPSRAAVHRLIGQRSISTTRRRYDDEGQLLHDEQALFASLPTPSAEWLDKDRPLSFKLEKVEAAFLKTRLTSVQKKPEYAKGNLQQSLLSRLAAKGNIQPVTGMWENFVLAQADVEDLQALERARLVSALAGIGRGIYTALVEEAQEREGLAASTVHREHLEELIGDHAADALALDISDLQLDLPTLSSRMVTILRETQKWLRRRGRQLSHVEALYLHQEVHRKGRRARLGQTEGARLRRVDWRGDEVPLAQTLHYRWANVHRLLADLEVR